MLGSLLLPGWAKYAAFAALVAAVIGTSYLKGMAHVQDQWDEQRAEDERAFLQAMVDGIHDRETTVQNLERQIATIKAKVVVERVPQYITVESDRGCVVPNGFVRVVNAAIEEVLPPAPGPTDAGPAKIELSTVAANTVGNYRTCHENAAQLSELQAYLERISE